MRIINLSDIFPANLFAMNKLYLFGSWKSLCAGLTALTLCLFAAPISAQTIPTPTQTDEIIIDNGTSGKADPNDRIRYKVTIQNTGGADATGTQLNITPDPRTTLVPGSFRSSPLAAPDMYACTGNVGINVPAASGVKANDFDDNLAGATLSCGACTSANGGTVVLNNDGSFTYTPPAGFTGTDNFMYTLTDGNPVGAPVPTTDNTTVTITVSNMVWFISNVIAGTGGTGTRLDPFKTIADFNAASGPAAGHTVYLQHTGTNYTHGIVLKNDMRFLGTGHTGGVTLADVLPFAVAPNSPTLPAINGTAPIITNAAGNGVTVAQNNTIRGIEVGNTPTGYAFVDNGGTTGTCTISECSVSGTGGIFRLINGGTINAAMNILASTATTSAFVLTNMAGTISNSGAGTITYNSGSADFVDINGGTISLTLTSALSATGGTGSLLDVSGAHTGSLTFNGSFDANMPYNGDGIQLDNADGTYIINGDMTVLSGTAGVNIQNGSGGTFNVSNTSSNIDNVTGISFRINTSTANVNYDGTITHTAQASRGIELITATGTISFDGAAQIGTLGAPMLSATGVFLNNNGAANLITFGDLNVVTGVGGGAGAPAFVSEVSGRIAVTTGSIDCNGNLGAGNHCFDVSNTTSSGVVFNSFLSDHDDLGENGGAIQLNNTPGTFTFQNVPCMTGANATILEANNFGTLNLGTVSTGNVQNGGAPVIDVSNGALNIALTTVSAFSTPTYGIRLLNTTGSLLNITGDVTVNSLAGANESILLNGVSTTNVNFGVGATVSITNRRSNGVSINNCPGTIQFGATTIPNPNNIASPAILVQTSGGTANFGATTIDNNGVAANCVSILNNSGTTTFASGGTISNSSIAELDVTQNAGNVTFSSAISNTAGGAVQVTSRTGGTVNVAGNIMSNVAATAITCSNNTGGAINFSGANKTITSSSATGVNLSTNTGSTINFTGGGLAISSTSGVGFNATGGGTVTVTTGANSNTITSTTGTALNVANTTIGASGLTFQSISANGAANGIVLNTTGASGGLTVTGAGSAGSGGTIRNAGTGISLTSTRNVSLTRMQLNDFSDFAIRGSSVVNFTLDNTVINGTNGNNGAADEGSVRFTELTGSASVTSCNISGGLEDNFAVINTSGTLNRITFSNTTFGANSTTDGSDGILVEGQNAAIVNVTVQNSFFTSTRGDHFQVNLIGTASTDLIFTGNAITNSHPAVVSGGGGIRLTGGAVGSNVTATYNFSNNTIRDSNGTAIGVTKGAGSGTFTGTINNNQVGVAGVANSGSAAGSGISVITAEGGSHTTTITNNQVRQYNNFGIIVQAGGLPTVGTGNLKATVTGNTISNPGTAIFAKNGFQLNSGTVPGDAFQVCLTFGGAGALRNSLVGSGTDGGTDFRLRQRQSTTVYLPGYAGANNDDAAVVTFAQTNNNLGGTPTGSATNNVPTGGGWLGSACPPF